MSWMCFLVLGTVLQAGMKPVVKSQPISSPPVTVCLLDNLLSLLLSSLPPSKSSSSLLSPLPLFTKSTQGLISHSLCVAESIWICPWLLNWRTVVQEHLMWSDVLFCPPWSQQMDLSLIFIGCTSLDNPIGNIFQLLQPLWSQPPKLGADVPFPTSLAARSIFGSDTVLAPAATQVCVGVLGTRVIQMLIWYQLLYCQK